MQIKLHKPTMAIGYSLRMCARHVESTNPGRSNLVFRSKPIPEAEMSNRLIAINQCTFIWRHFRSPLGSRDVESAYCNQSMYVYMAPLQVFTQNRFQPIPRRT